MGWQIGKGAYAEVWLATHKTTKFRVAIKVYEKSWLVDSSRKRAVLKEIWILSSLCNLHVIKLYEAFQSET